tara:strand:- start:457 stop:744 length:288 start_codon:yes stop_codon:yes gene_type:complete
LVSPHRTKRPWQGKVEKTAVPASVTYDKNCYLCPGNERTSGKTNNKYSKPYSFVNDFSALLEDIPSVTLDNGLLKAKSEKGVCKVVCFSPKHGLT